MTQTALLCGCGAPDSRCTGFCTRCERRARLSREKFDGLREQALERDDHQCQCCGELDPALVLVHHRRPGHNRLKYLVTICRRCHIRVHLTFRPAFAFALHPLLYQLWREVHRRFPRQTLLSFGSSVAAARQAALFDGPIDSGSGPVVI